MSSPAPTTNPFLATLAADSAAVVAAGESAWTTVKADLATLIPPAMAALGAAITKAVADAEAGDSIEDIETDVLNILEDSVSTIIQAFTSNALQVLITFAKAV